MNKLLCALLATSALAATALAKDYEVKMLNKNSEGTMVFEPGFLHIQPGDTVTFVPTDKGHDAKSTLIPEGAKPFSGKINEKLTVTFDTEGIYLYDCVPHIAMNMRGIIQVGKAVNYDAIMAEVPKIDGKAALNKGRLIKYAEQIQK